ncbi:hypothetical protein B0H19DRAFT_1245313 [Mycena capillaripes]|nr:hypothetical protein B0H19DRAFT_1245313 [Mycena capillaripes]
MQSVADNRFTHAPHPSDAQLVSAGIKQFKLICTSTERPIICSLSIVDHNGDSVDEFVEVDPRWKLSFVVEVSPQLAQSTAERLQDALNEDSVQVLNAAATKGQGSPSSST